MSKAAAWRPPSIWSISLDAVAVDIVHKNDGGWLKGLSDSAGVSAAP
jgi:hypothetical protein